MIFLVAAIEGEGALVAGAVLSQRGHMSFGGAVVASFLGTFLVAEGMFHLARWKGRAWVVQKAGGRSAPETHRTVARSAWQLAAAGCTFPVGHADLDTGCLRGGWHVR